MTNRLIDAIQMAAEAHRFQTRKADNSSYICHPLAVMDILRTWAKVENEDILIAAVLHDTVEDTPVTIEQIRERFGWEVADIVAEVTDDRTLARQQRKRAQLAKVQNKSVAARLVKMADMLHNLMDLLVNPPADWSDKKIQGYFVWKRAIWLKGIKGIKPCLDMAFGGLLTNKLKSGAPVLPDTDLDNFLEDYLSNC